MAMKDTAEFDYLIVGAGSAGCALAQRLTEDGNTQVLLLEAGGWDVHPWIHIPLAWGRILKHRMYDWNYAAEPDVHVDGREVECARGKVVGGSSSINAMAYVRGNRADYDRWAAYGLQGWAYSDVLPYFRKQESWSDGATAYRGGGGPLGTRRSGYRDPIVEAFIQAGVAAGYPRNDDYNAERQEGFALMQSTIKDGRRHSAASAYLRPALKRPNLQVRVHTLVTRVVFEGTRAVGVEYVRNGQTHTVRARREVLLAGGVINSAQLLMLSGIGHPDELRACAIDVRVPLPGVGKNLQDHVSGHVSYRRREPGPFHKMMRLDRIGKELTKAYFCGTGFATDLPSGYVAFLKTRPGLDCPDIQFLSNLVPINAGPYMPPFCKGFEDGFTIRPVLLHPESRGRLQLRSADPAQPVRIFQNLLSMDNDVATLREGIKIAREVARQSPLAAYVGEEIDPGAACISDAQIEAHLRATAMTAHHPIGTCKMGADSDDMAVVDAALRVRGASGLRVVDASVMPDLVSGNINAAVIMIAEKAADLIRNAIPQTQERMALELQETP